MKSRFVINCYLLTGFDVAEGYEENVVIENLHERIWLARMVNVVRAVSTKTSVKTPASVDFTNA
jgi:hypothetical protein